MPRAFRIEVYTEPTIGNPNGFVGKYETEADHWREAVEKLEREMQTRPESDNCRFEYCTKLPGFCRNPE